MSGVADLQPIEADVLMSGGPTQKNVIPIPRTEEMEGPGQTLSIREPAFCLVRYQAIVFCSSAAAIRSSCAQNSALIRTQRIGPTEKCPENCLATCSNSSR